MENRAAAQESPIWVTVFSFALAGAVGCAVFATLWEFAGLYLGGVPRFAVVSVVIGAIVYVVNSKSGDGR